MTGPDPANSWPPPAYPPMARPRWTPPRRRRSRWLTIGLPVGLVLLLGGCGTAVVLLIGTLRDALGPATDAASAYAEALVDQRWEDAHAQLCADVREATTAADLAEHFARPALTGYSLEGVSVRTSNGRESASAEIRFTTADGLDTRTTLPLEREDGTWRPCP